MCEFGSTAASVTNGGRPVAAIRDASWCGEDRSVPGCEHEPSHHSSASGQAKRAPSCVPLLCYRAEFHRPPARGANVRSGAQEGRLSRDVSRGTKPPAEYQRTRQAVPTPFRTRELRSIVYQSGCNCQTVGRLHGGAAGQDERQRVVGPALLKIVKTETSKTVASGLIKSDQWGVYMRPSSSLRSKVSA